MVPKCSKRTHNSNEWKENIYFLFQDLFAFDMVLAWSVLNATIKRRRGRSMVEFEPLKSFFGWSLLSARPNWDQLGWSVPLQNIVLASVGPKHGLLQLTNIRVCNRLALIKAFPGTSFDSMWLGTHWTRCPARPCSSWRTSTSSTYPSTKSSTSRRTPLLVT